MGENPAVGSAQRRAAARRRWRKLDWLVVRDLVEIETAAFWHDAPGDRAGRAAHRGHRHRGVLPARRRAHREGRHLHQHPAAAAVARQGGRAAGRLPLGAVVHVPPRPAHARAARRLDRRRSDRPILDLTWDYPTAGPARRARRRGRAAARSTAATADGTLVADVPRSSKDDGSTACGCWIYCGLLRRRRQPDRAAQARHASRTGSRPSGAGRGRRTAASSTTAPPPTPTGRPWSERKRYVWWDADAGQVDGLRRPRLPGRQAARLPAARRTRRAWTRSRGDEPFIMQADGQGWLFAPSGPASTGRCRRTTSRTSRRSHNPLYPAAAPTRRRSSWTRAGQPVPPRRTTRASRSSLTTYRLTEHHTAGGMSRCAAVPGRAAARDVLRGRARSWPRERGLEHGGWATIVTARAAIEARVLVTERMRAAARRRAAPSTRSACPTTGARDGLVTRRRRPTTCSPLALDPNVHIQEAKACDLRHPRRAGGRAGRRCSRSSTEYRRRAGIGDARDDRGRQLRRRGPPRVGFFTDTTLCIGCKACEVACKEWNHVPERRPRASPATSYDNTGDLGADTWRHVAFVEQRDAGRRTTDGLPLADVLRRLQALHRRRLPRRLPDRRAVPHRVRHRRRPAGHLQRLRLLRARPARSACSTGARTTAAPGSARSATTASRTTWSRPARKACPTDSIQFGELDELRERAGERARGAARGGRGRARSSTATTRTTASAAPARSSCCSTSPRSTGCRPTRSTRRATSARCGGARGGARGAGARRPALAAAVLAGRRR